MWFGKLPVKIFSLQNVKSLLSQLVLYKYASFLSRNSPLLRSGSE